MITTEKIAILRAGHHRVEFSDLSGRDLIDAEHDGLADPHCEWCCEDWPCTTTQLLDEVEKLRAMVEGLVDPSPEDMEHDPDDLLADKEARW